MTQHSDLWFLNTFVTVRVSEADGNDGISILEHRAPYRDSPPLHIHHTEDEIFQIVEGVFRLKIGEEEHRLSAGDFLVAPKGVPHSYCVESAQGGHWLTTTAAGDFERFVRAISRPAAHPELPEPGGPPSEKAIHMLATTAAQFGIELVGPPLQ